MKKTIDIPHFIKDLSAKASKIIIDQMNLDRDHNWRDVVMEVWPHYTMDDIEIKFKEGKMTKVLQEMASSGKQTVDLFKILIKLERKNILINLEDIYPSIREFII